MALTFRGGSHVREYKNTRNCPIETMPAPEKVYISMAQHIGAPCAPLVQCGEHVLRGQCIGAVTTGLGCPVHASVSGTVCSIAEKTTPSGAKVCYVTIENDGQNQIDPALQPYNGKISALTPEQIIETVRQAGICGMGGAMFPTHVKISSGIGKVDTIIINAAECEPYITADDRLCREYPEEVISGLRVIMKILGLQKAHIAMEDNKPEAARALKRALAGQTDIVVDVLPAKYPQGAEKQLIYAVTGREVPSGGLPAAVGCAVFNSATCKAIHDAVYLGMPLVKRVVTVSGDIALDPKNLLVCIGTPFLALMDSVGNSENPYKVLSGGPMMGVTQYDLMVPVIKGVNAVTILGRKNRFAVDEPRCLRCGKCIEACPMRLMPVLMYKAMQTGSTDEMKAVNLMDCIECGCCAYVCPASVPLVLGFRAGKQRLRDAAAKAKA